jgi:hypothetical protein
MTRCTSCQVPTRNGGKNDILPFFRLSHTAYGQPCVGAKKDIFCLFSAATLQHSTDYTCCDFGHLRFSAFSSHFRLQRFEKTNEMLSNCNSLSASRLERATRDFRNHMNYLTDLKKDLEVVFKRIRAIKSKATNQNPESFRGKIKAEQFSQIRDAF